MQVVKVVCVNKTTEINLVFNRVLTSDGTLVVEVSDINGVLVAPPHGGIATFQLDPINQVVSEVEEVKTEVLSPEETETN